MQMHLLIGGGVLLFAATILLFAVSSAVMPQEALAQIPEANFGSISGVIMFENIHNNSSLTLVIHGSQHINVDFSGTATRNDDYRATLTQIGSFVTLGLTSFTDSTTEGDETIIITILPDTANPARYSVPSQNTLTITLKDAIPASKFYIDIPDVTQGDDVPVTIYGTSDARFWVELMECIHGHASLCGGTTAAKIPPIIHPEIDHSTATAQTYIDAAMSLPSGHTGDVIFEGTSKGITLTIKTGTPNEATVTIPPKTYYSRSAFIDVTGGSGTALFKTFSDADSLCDPKSSSPPLDSNSRLI